MALAQPKSSLPSTQQRRRQAVEAQLGADAAAAALAATKAETEAAAAKAALDATQAAADPATAATDEPVTLTRAQLNELQGASDRSARAERDAELARMEAEEARAALTDIKTSRKEPSQADVPFDMGYSDTDIALLPEEEERFGESTAFVLKLVRAECARLFKLYDARITPRIAEARTVATDASNRVVRSAQKTFTGRVREKVQDVDALVSHANFKDFLESIVPMTSMSYNTALNNAHSEENLSAAVDIFNAFRTKYGVTKPSASGYAGANPTSAAAPAPETKKNKHSMAERKKKSEDYRKGRITKTEFDEYKASFDEANAKGLVDQ